ncbi:hemagglutinin, partial [Ralstonia holmesii]
SGGQVLNTGNLLGSTVDVSGAALTNGITNPNQPTPPTVAGRQVISLAPPPGPTGALQAASTAGSGPTAQSGGAAPTTSGASGGAPQANVAPVQAPVWSFQPAIVTTPAAPGSSQVTWHFNAPAAGNTTSAPTPSVNGATYLNQNPATSVLAGVTPNSLLAQLPANLQPGSTPFYFDPFTEDQKLLQAAQQQTGQSSFISGLTYDNQNQLSVTDQEKLILYKDAADYAKAHNIQLGQALTQQQIAELDKPMLWYVTQQVPDPNCNTVASTACPMVSALVPQLYLPAGYADAITQPAGGVIAGQNVNLNVDGTLRNSGQVTASDTLNVKAGTIDNAPNVVDIGTSAYKVDGGWLQVTGTQVQPGGFMSAVNLNVQANAINAVNDAFVVRNADGSVDQTRTDALISQLQANLGGNYTAGTVKDDIHQDFIKEQSALPTFVVMVIALVAAVVTAGAAAAAIAAAQVAAAEAGMATLIATGSVEAATAAGGIMASSVFAAGGMANLAIAGALGGMAASAVSQIGLNGRLDLGQTLIAGAAGAITGGVTGYFGANYGIDRLLASTAAGCGTAAMSGGDCKSGAISGFATAAIAWAGDAMRQNQVESSRQFKGIADENAPEKGLVTNVSGPSQGINGDGVKLAGTRVSFDDLRTVGNVVPGPDGTMLFEGTQINPLTGKVYTLDGALTHFGGATGGAQGLAGTLGSYSYSSGTVVDKLLESFAGPHDFMGSIFAYDKIGNLKEGMSALQRNLFEIQTDIDIPLSAPFAGTTFLNQYGLDWSTFRRQFNQSQEKR